MCGSGWAIRSTSLTLLRSTTANTLPTTLGMCGPFCWSRFLVTRPNKMKHCFCCHPATLRIFRRLWHLAAFLESTQLSGVGIRLYSHFKRFKNHWSHQLRLLTQTDHFGSWCEQMELIFQRYRWVAYPLGWGAWWFLTQDKSDHVVKKAAHQDFPCVQKNALAALAAVVQVSIWGELQQISSHLFMFNWCHLRFGILPSFKSGLWSSSILLEKQLDTWRLQCHSSD